MVVEGVQDILFYIFAGLTLGFGSLVLIRRNPVTSAMFLVLTLVSLTGLFVLLHAYFLAAIQILVYAGAVMVLFLFVIMLLDLKAEEGRRIRMFAVAGATVSVGVIGAVFVACLRHSKPGGGGLPTIEGGTIALGRLLFTRYLLPFEIVSVLLLVAMVGVILLSKKDLR
jgi:NADH-quinone oxidoreductase subunit J